MGPNCTPKSVVMDDDLGFGFLGFAFEDLACANSFVMPWP